VCFDNILDLLIHFSCFLLFCFVHPQRSLPPEWREVLQERFAKELAEFLSVYEGKLLGTAAWRRMTGRPLSQVNIVELTLQVKMKYFNFPIVP